MEIVFPMVSFFLLLHFAIYSIQPVEEGIPGVLKQSLLSQDGVENVMWQEWQGLYQATVCYKNGETVYQLYDHFGNLGIVGEELGIIELPQHIYADLKIPSRHYTFISAKKVSGFKDGDFYLIRLSFKREIIEILMN